MLFRQFFEPVSSTYTYLLANPGGDAVLIDPVHSEVDKYLRFIHELDLVLVRSLDTHVHADHITGLGALRDATTCATMMGAQSKAECVTANFSDGDFVGVPGIDLRAMYTPGHTDDSYSFLLAEDGATGRVFTGDTLLIRGTGRTDFQGGDARTQYRSLFDGLLRLPPETAVYPGHDYKGWTVSSIGEEIAHNPRLQVADIDEYADLMNGLGLANPKQMHIAVPANLRCGRVSA